MLFIPEFPWSDLHTLNLDWLLSVVANHERQLQDIEGSATPYDGAPLADGAGDPGTVNQYARGDHRHPTDTTRASAEALQALQDTIPLPSNGLPKMNGQANAGYYSNYSRADHVHPSDTTKANNIRVEAVESRVGQLEARYSINFIDMPTLTNLAPSSSNHYIAVDYPAEVIGKKIVSIICRNYQGNTAPFSIIPFLATGTAPKFYIETTGSIASIAFRVYFLNE